MHMTKHFIPVAITVCTVMLGAALLTACSTTRLQSSEMLSSQEKAGMLKRAKPPQVYGLTAYASDQGAIFAGAFRQHQGHATRIQFSSDKNSTAPVLGINGGKTLMLIDSAAAESWVTLESAVRLRVAPMAAPNSFEKLPRHVYDTVGGFAGVLSKITLEKLHVESAVLYIRNARGPLDALTRWERTPYLDGVLGSDFLRSFEFVRISLRGRYMVFSATDPYPDSGNRLAVLPLIDLQGGLAAEVMIDGEKAVAMIDIAGDYELALENPTTRRVRQLSLGDVVFRQVEVDSAFDQGFGFTSPPRIGRQLLERYDIVISDRGRQLIIERPTR